MDCKVMLDDVVDKESINEEVKDMGDDVDDIGKMASLNLKDGWGLSLESVLESEEE